MLELNQALKEIKEDIQNLSGQILSDCYQCGECTRWLPDRICNGTSPLSGNPTFAIK